MKSLFPYIIFIFCTSTAFAQKSVAPNPPPALPNESYSVLSETFEETKTKAEKGDSTSQNELALGYARGRNVKRDLNAAFNWWSKAAAQNHPGAQYNLGVMYFKGEALPADKDKAFRLWVAAADQGNRRAFERLEKALRNGENVIEIWEGVHPSRKQEKMLNNLRKTASKLQQLDSLREAAAQNDPEAQYNLGNLFYEGKAVPIDQDKAFHLWAEAADQGHEGAFES